MDHGIRRLLLDAWKKSVMVGPKLDVICLGRAAVDLYGEQLGVDLPGMRTFRKYLGGSSANMAVGMAKQGLSVGMITCVGDEAMGQFVRSELAANGVDVTQVSLDKDRLTGLAILAIKDEETFPLLFYRENCADMAIQPSDIDEDYIASAKFLTITGTHFSNEEISRASMTAVNYARANGTQTVLDIDYRPVLWGVAGHGEGESRFVAADSVTNHIQDILPLFDLVIGTEEEVQIAGGSTDTLAALQAIRQLTDATIVLKRGPLGCAVFEDTIPGDINDGFLGEGVAVDVHNVVGAGDAFMSGFMRGWVQDKSVEAACTYGNTCGALVVTRHECAPAIPTKLELDDFLERRRSSPELRPDSRLELLHRLTSRKPENRDIYVLAFDHRVQLEVMAKEQGVDTGQIAKFKAIVGQALRLASAHSDLDGRIGLIADSGYGSKVLAEFTDTDCWIARPVELPTAKPLQFEAGDNVGLELVSWPTEHVVKVLVNYHADDAASVREATERRVLELYEACVKTEHELLFEVIVPEGSTQEDTTVADVMARFYDLDIFPDWWKLPPPTVAGWAHVNRVIDTYDPYCHGVLLLGLDAPEAVIAAGFKAAAGQDKCRGFAVGRTIFSAPARQWMSGAVDDEEAIEVIAGNYIRIVKLWQGRNGRG